MMEPVRILWLFGNLRIWWCCCGKLLRWIQTIINSKLLLPAQLSVRVLRLHGQVHSKWVISSCASTDCVTTAFVSSQWEASAQTLLLEHAARNCFWQMKLPQLKTCCNESELNPVTPDLLGHLEIMFITIALIYRTMNSLSVWKWDAGIKMIQWLV